MTAPARQLLRNDRLQGHEKVLWRILDGKAPARRHHADNRVGTRGKNDLLPNDLRIARKGAMPALIRQDDHTRIDLILGAGIATTEERRDAEHIENIGGDSHALQQPSFFVTT